MTIIRLKGFQIFDGRHKNGDVYCYHRETKTPVDLKQFLLGSAAFFAECARITELSKITAPAKPGTLGHEITEYKKHPAFTDLAPHTRKDYQRIFDYLKPIEDTPLSRFDPPLVVGIRDKAAERGRRFGPSMPLLVLGHRTQPPLGCPSGDAAPTRSELEKISLPQLFEYLTDITNTDAIALRDA